jgi:addiction module HigA family antidote
MKTKKLGIQMYQPGHPGEVIREACLKPLDLSVTAAAEGLGVTRKTLSELLNGHSGVSLEMALRLAAAGWSTAETWLEMQLAYDLWQVRNRTGDLHVKQFLSPAAA